MLLPRFMPLNRKYALLESLWEKLAPRSEYSIAFGRDSNARDLGDVVDQHLTATVNGHTIPDALQSRFKWLADGDAQVMQVLLNHFQMRDRQQTIAAVCAEVALILQHTQNNAACPRVLPGTYNRRTYCPHFSRPARNASELIAGAAAIPSSAGLLVARIAGCP